MSLVLARIDQRLIHGIVITQWTGATKAKRLMVVDDEVSKDEIQKQAMRMSKPAGTGMSIIDTDTAIKNFNAGKYDNHNVFMVVREPSTLIRLKETVSRFQKSTSALCSMAKVSAPSRKWFLSMNRKFRISRRCSRWASLLPSTLFLAKQKKALKPIFTDLL